MLMRRTLSLALMALFIATGAQAKSILHEESSAPKDVANYIEDMVIEWASKFSRGDWMRIKDTWDPDEKMPMYLGEERDQWVIGQEGLDEYFNPPGENTSVETVVIKPFRLRVRLIADNIAVATWENQLDFKIKTRPAVQDNYRVNAVFRKKGDDWFFIQYAEMPMVALSYVEHLYRKSVSKGFPENGKPYDGGRSKD